MGNLFVVGFDEPNQAEEVHFKLQKLQSEGLLDLADVAVAVKDALCEYRDGSMHLCMTAITKRRLCLVWRIEV